MSDLPIRVRNRLRRIAGRVPTDVVWPGIQNDVYQAHVSLFDFFSAFAVGRDVLFHGQQAAWGGVYVKEHGAARSVTGVIDSSRVRKFARGHAIADVVFPDSTGAGPFELTIRSDGPYEDALRDAERLTATGKLLLSAPPGLELRVTVDALRARFASVRRFAHVAIAPIDLASPARSTLTPFSFRYVELGSHEAPPPGTLTIVILCTNEPKWRELQLHVGCGPVVLPGWVNIDNLPYPGIDFLWDAARGIPFRNARYVFAEHFIEHLSYSQAREFIAMCRAMLRDDGILRMSTPNLDWVWLVSYHPQQWTSTAEALHDCFVTNRAFRGWGHQFLYNFPTLSALLRNAGFAHVSAVTYGESATAALAGLEHHERYPDSPDLPHVVVIEATGRAAPQEIEGAAIIAEYERDVAVR
jgi:predicted SAM-dependent methyltransferase